MTDRKAISLPGLPQKLQNQKHFQPAHDNSRWQKSTQVWCLLEKLPRQVGTGEALQNAHWRKTFGLRYLRPEVFPEGSVETAPDTPQWSEKLCVRSVPWKEGFQNESWFENAHAVPRWTKVAVQLLRAQELHNVLLKKARKNTF